jgi:nucleoside-diphosphate-sugar epimerase
MTDTQNGPRTCLVTGANGHLGAHVKAALQARGWNTVDVTRQPAAGSNGVRLRLGEDIAPALLAGAQALVHCAYDFKQLSWDEIRRVNVLGSDKLFRAARAAGVQRIVYISTISAFEGCRSLYGKAKLETEQLAHAAGAAVVRPGLIYGNPPQAMFGSLVAQVENAKVLPLFGGGAQLQYLIHEQDLCTLICALVDGSVTLPAGPLTAAHDAPWSFRRILEEIARGKGRTLKFVPAPWRLLWAGIRTAEALHVPLQFRSDSLLSLMYQNPAPSFADYQRLGLPCRPFSWEAAQR